MTDKLNSIPSVRVDVWAVKFDDLFASGLHQSDLLNAEELQRVAAFRHEPSRDRYAASRAFLRERVSENTGIAPNAIVFEYNEFGKPSVDCGPKFNQSHSNSTLLLALCNAVELGVDVEEINLSINPWELAKSCFSDREQAELAGITDLEDAHQHFIRGWTRKEAVIKALGGGLSIPLKDFSVSLEADNVDALLQSQLARLSRSEWTVTDLQLPNTIAALALPIRQLSIELKT